MVPGTKKHVRENQDSLLFAVVLAACVTTVVEPDSQPPATRVEYAYVKPGF